MGPHNVAALICTLAIILPLGIQTEALSDINDPVSEGILNDLISRLSLGFKAKKDGESGQFGTKEVQFARQMLRFTDMADTKLDAMFSDIEKREEFGITKMNKVRLLELIKEFLFKHADRLKEIQERNKAVAESEEVQREEWDTPCYRDYRTYVENITNALVRLLLKMILGDGTDPIHIIAAELLDQFFPRRGEAFPEWGFPFIDAVGKIPTGILDGNFHWVGAYEMCLEQNINHFYNATKPNEQRSFTGKYCRVDIGAKPLDPDEGIQPNETIALSLTLGLCVPSSCSKEGVIDFLTNDTLGRDGTRLVGAIFSILDAEVTDIFCGRGEQNLLQDQTGRAASIILLTLVALMIIGTIWDGAFRKSSVLKEFEEHGAPGSSGVDALPPLYESISDQPVTVQGIKLQTLSSETVSTASLMSNNKEDHWQLSPGILGRVDMFFVSFSLYTSFRRLFEAKGRSDHIPVIDGIKYLSMCYLILGQSYLLGPVVSFVTVTSNILRALSTMPKQWTFMPILAFHHVADSFFVCSGVLVTLYWFRRIERNNNSLTFWLVIRNILHWYWRLMPSMMLTMMIFVVFYKYISVGPLVVENIPFAENCRPNWWANMLMIQNLVKLDQQCMAWTWYFSAIFQLNLVATLVLTVYYFQKFVAIAIIGVLIAIHYGVTAYQSDSILKSGILGGFRTWNNYLYITPWCHAGSYFFGVLLALLLRKINFKANHHFFIRLLGWVMGLGLIILAAFVPYDMYRDLDLTKWTRAGQVAYDTLSRTAWSLGIVWIIYAGITGNGGFINDFLSWPAFRPLARMTYSMYIMHAIAILRYMYSRKTLLYVAPNEMVYIFCANILMTHAFGLAVNILVEFPFRGLEKMLTVKTKYDVMMAGCHPAMCDEEDSRNKVASRKRAMEESLSRYNDLGPANMEGNVHL